VEIISDSTFLKHFSAFEADTGEGRIGNRSNEAVGERVTKEAALWKKNSNDDEVKEVNSMTCFFVSSEGSPVVAEAPSSVGNHQIDDSYLVAA